MATGSPASDRGSCEGRDQVGPRDDTRDDAMLDDGNRIDISVGHHRKQRADGRVRRCSRTRHAHDLSSLHGAIPATVQKSSESGNKPPVETQGVFPGPGYEVDLEDDTQEPVVRTNDRKRGELVAPKKICNLFLKFKMLGFYLSKGPFTNIGKKQIL